MQKTQNIKILKVMQNQVNKTLDLIMTAMLIALVFILHSF